MRRTLAEHQENQDVTGGEKEERVKEEEGKRESRERTDGRTDQQQPEYQ